MQKSVSDVQMLQGAVIQGDLNSVRTILGSGDESTNPSHGSCICLAASKGHRNIVELLLKHGFSVDEEDAQGRTAIYHTVERDDFETTELLLRNGADPNGKYDLLSSAARKGFVSVVKVLVDFGADINKNDDYGQTPLHHAILQCSAMFTFLGERVKTSTCAMEKVVNILLGKGADVNAKTVNGFSPLHFAIKFKYARIVSDLLKHGADFRSLVDSNVESPKLAQFCLKSNQNSATSVRSLFKPRLTTVLHIAAESNDIASLRLLLSAGASVDSVQYDGTTPLIVSITRRHSEIVKILLEFGANVQQKNKYGLSPLHVACRTGSVNALNALLEAGADINSICNKGMVPYQYVLQLEVEKSNKHISCEDIFDTGHYYRQCYNHSLNIKQILHSQLTVMYIYGFYLQDYNKKIGMKIPSIFHDVSKNDIQDFLKSVIICTNVTVFKVINDTMSANYVRNPNVLKGLDRAVAVTNAKYPGLGNFVMLFVRCARERKMLIDNGIEWFVHLNTKNNRLPTLPFDVLEIVFSFLMDNEIQIFTTCCESIIGE